MNKPLSEIICSKFLEEAVDEWLETKKEDIRFRLETHKQRLNEQ